MSLFLCGSYDATPPKEATITNQQQTWVPWDCVSPQLSSLHPSLLAVPQMRPALTTPTSNALTHTHAHAHTMPLLCFLYGTDHYETYLLSASHLQHMKTSRQMKNWALHTLGTQYSHLVTDSTMPQRG